MQPVTSRSVVMYGNSGSTKTSQCYLLAKWLLAKPENAGKRFRLIYADGGGYAPFVDSGMIERGQIEVFDFSNRPNAFADFRKLSSGFWPVYNVKAQDGTVFPEYFRRDGNCETKDWDKILGYIIEGMSSCAEAIKTHISELPEGGAGFKEAWKFEEDGEVLTGLTQGHYGMVQKEMYSRHMHGFKTLPVQWLIYTSLLGMGEDKKRGETCYGPQVAGNASTPHVPSWFMDCLHLDHHKWKTKNKEGEIVDKEGMVAWYQNHYEGEIQPPCPYLAKARVLPEWHDEFMGYFPGGFVPLDKTHGIAKYFHAMELIKRKHNGQSTST